MDSSLVLGIGALAVSVVALATSTWLALRQVGLMRRANHLPVLIDYLSEYRNSSFVEQEESIWRQLPAADQDVPLSQLPADIRVSAYSVSVYYQILANVMAFSALDTSLAVLVTHYRAVRTWEAVEPHVRAERRLRGDPYSFLNFFEEFVLLIRRTDIPDTYRNVLRRSFSDRAA